MMQENTKNCLDELKSKEFEKLLLCALDSHKGAMVECALGGIYPSDFDIAALAVILMSDEGTKNISVQVLSMLSALKAALVELREENKRLKELFLTT